MHRTVGRQHISYLSICKLSHQLVNSHYYGRYPLICFNSLFSQFQEESIQLSSQTCDFLNEVNQPCLQTQTTDTD